ncbi:MAG: cytochrome c-type biogenesis protein [Novosphingobium sp.]
MARALFAALVLMVSAMIASPLTARDYAQEALPNAQKEAQATTLMDSIRCIVCQGQPISGSNADLAGDMRRVIREQIAAGKSPDEVRAWLVSRYGDWVSFKPVVKPETLPLWAVPLIALLGGAWLVSRRIRPKRVTSDRKSENDQKLEKE